MSDAADKGFVATDADDTADADANRGVYLIPSRKPGVTHHTSEHTIVPFSSALLFVPGICKEGQECVPYKSCQAITDGLETVLIQPFSRSKC